MKLYVFLQAFKVFQNLEGLKTGGIHIDAVIRGHDGEK